MVALVPSVIVLTSAWLGDLHGCCIRCFQAQALDKETIGRVIPKEAGPNPPTPGPKMPNEPRNWAVGPKSCPNLGHT